MPLTLAVGRSPLFRKKNLHSDVLPKNRNRDDKSMSKPILNIYMSFAVRLSLTGMIGLALLTSTQWARQNIFSTNILFQLFLGVSPNIAAGYAMPLIFASFIEKIAKNENKNEAHKFYLLVSAFTTLGLIVWEFIQIDSKNLYFDTNDIIATFIGTFLAYVSYLWLANLKLPNEQSKIDNNSDVTKKD